MTKTVILICALGMPRAECDLQTAEAVIQGPMAAHAGRCGLLGQAYLAETPLADYLDGEHYLKINCTFNDQRPVMVQRARDGKSLTNVQRSKR